MKQARAADHWRRLASKRQKNHIRSFLVGAVEGLPADVIVLGGPITAITGLNGVGKSTLIHAVRLLIRRGESLKIDMAALRDCKGEILGDVEIDQKKIGFSAKFSSGVVSVEPKDTNFSVTWIDLPFDVPFLITEFRREQNLNEALDQVSTNNVVGEDLEDLSWMIGKDYEEIKFYELEDFADRPVIPYFKVKSAGIEYGTEAMGLGEASLHYLWWHLKRLPPQSVVLIEEPETYVSARSQSAFIDLLARTCLIRNSSAIVTTHSPHVFAKIPPKDTLILLKDGKQSKIIIRDSEESRQLALGVPTLIPKAGVLLVEDRMAREFASAWLRRHNPDMLRGWRIVDVESSGQILNKLEHFPILGDWFIAVGLFDGDERDKGHKSKGRFCFLPGNAAPEILLQNAIRRSPEDISRLLKVELELLHIILSSIEGLDHHDWFLELVRRLANNGVSFSSLVEVSFDCWVALDDNQNLSRIALDDLVKIAAAQE